MKRTTSRYGILALLMLFALILLAKQPLHARPRPEPDPACAPACVAAITLEYDLEAAAELVGQSYLFLGHALYSRHTDVQLEHGSIAARFDDVIPMWAPESVHVLSVARSADYLPYRVTVRAHSTGAIGYFEVTSLAQVNRFLLMAAPSHLSTAGH